MSYEQLVIAAALAVIVLAVTADLLLESAERRENERRELRRAAALQDVIDRERLAHDEGLRAYRSRAAEREGER
jgi:hypothetical protein